MSALRRVLAGVLAVCWAVPLAAQALALPLKTGSVRFAVIGDTGTGDQMEEAVGRQMALYRQKFPFTFTIMLGDNIYGSERPQDFDKKFIKPYKALLDAKVLFYATLGNHDDPNQRFYKPFNMGGVRYHTFKKGNVRFFVIDSNYLDPDQIKWLEKELAASGSDWKIPYFHHPLYTTAARGPEVELRSILEPLFVKYGVDVVFSGHEHVYERLRPQKGVYYFTAGGAAKLRGGDTRKGPLTDATFDTDRSFMLVEISGNDLYFQAISRTGKTVDKGVLHRLAHNPVVKPATTAKPK
ncbi:MAG TPA: metallophosphoesterase [Gemmatimonadales bacterium]